MSDSNNESIKPASVSLTAFAPSDTTTASQSVWRSQPLVLFCLLAIIALTIVVIFVLPGKIPTTDEAPKTTTITPTAPPKLLEDSPFNDAQLARDRKRTQEVLQNLLEVQDLLNEMGVEVWAKEEYALAVEQAKLADQLYREQKFRESTEKYQAAYDQLDALGFRSDEIFTKALNAGYQAIEAGDAKEAKKQFDLAALINSEDGNLQLGQARTEVLEQVTQRIKTAREYERQQEFAKARAEYKAAQILDPYTTGLDERIENVQDLIRERNFASEMSSGFGALGQGEYSAAITAFERAIKIKPGSNEAVAALAQAKNSQTQTKVQKLLSNVRTSVAAEMWAESVADFKSILQLDPNSVSAKVGLVEAQERLKIDTKLVSILDNPLPLATPSVYREYQTFIGELRKIPQPGPRLTEQIEGLQLALKQALEPVAVQITSDNSTEVTLYRVGPLGVFDQQQLKLTPGRYTLLGSRDGYRDVRQEFDVQPGQSLTITIKCDEKIDQG